MATDPPQSVVAIGKMYDPSRTTIRGLLAHSDIRVPEYQRPFSWRTKEVETFWSDVRTFSDKHSGDAIRSREYFLGSVVVVSDPGGGRTLLDGQQRLVTSTLLLAAIRDALAVAGHERAALQLQDEFLRREEFDESGNSTSVCRLNLGIDVDHDFYERLALTPVWEGKSPPTPRQESHRLMTKARDTLVSALASYNGPNQPATAADLFRLKDVISNRLTLIAIVSADHDSAALVFETLNDRGLALSSGDLLRNLLIRNQPSKTTHIATDWDNVRSALNRIPIDQFLRHWWNTYAGDVKARSLYCELRDYLRCTKRTSTDLLGELKSDVAVYKGIREGRTSIGALRQPIAAIGMLKSRPLYPVALAVSHLPIQLHKRGAVLLARLVSLFVRHALICRRDKSELENVAFRIAKLTRVDKNVDAAGEQLRSIWPSDAEFAAAFARTSLPDQRSQKFVLIGLERYLRGPGPELDVDDKITVEHIQPRTPSKKEQKWPKQSEWVSRIGNLTLLSGPRNASLSNKSYPRKRPRYLESELKLTRSLAEEYTRWNRRNVKARQADLSKLAVRAWALE